MNEKETNAVIMEYSKVTGESFNELYEKYYGGEISIFEDLDKALYWLHVQDNEFSDLENLVMKIFKTSTSELKDFSTIGEYLIGTHSSFDTVKLHGKIYYIHSYE